MKGITETPYQNKGIFKVNSLSYAINNLELIVLLVKEADCNNRAKSKLLLDSFSSIIYNEIILFADSINT